MQRAGRRNILERLPVRDRILLCASLQNGYNGAGSFTRSETGRFQAEAKVRR